MVFDLQGYLFLRVATAKCTQTVQKISVRNKKNVKRHQIYIDATSWRHVHATVTSLRQVPAGIRNKEDRADIQMVYGPKQFYNWALKMKSHHCLIKKILMIIE